MCVIKHKGKEVGKVPACAVNAEAYINELASHYGDLNIEYVYDANAAFLAAMHGGVRRDIPKIDSNNEEEESTSLQEVLKKKTFKNVKVSDDPKLVRKYNNIIKWFNDNRAKQARQTGKKAPTPLPLAKLIKPNKLATAKQTGQKLEPSLPTSKLGKLIQKSREKGSTTTGGKMGSKLIAPSIYKMRVGKARGKAPSPKSVAIKTIEPTVPHVPFEPKWKEPKIDIIRSPEPTIPITQPNKLLTTPAQPKLLAAPTTTATSPTTTTPKPAEQPKVTVTPPPETLPDTTPQIIKDYNNTNYVDLNTTKQYEIERNVRNKTIDEKNAFKTLDNEIYMKLSRYVEIRNKRLEAWRTKLKNEVTSLIEGMPVQKIMIFSSASQRTNVFIRKGVKLGTVHYGIIDIGRETRWVSKSDFYGEITTFQKSPLKREPDDIRYYVSPQERKPKYERTSEIDTLIARMIGITDKPTIGIFALDKALVKYRFLDKSIFGFKSEEEPFARVWDPSNPRPLDELKEIIRVIISEKLLLEFVRSSIK